MKKWTSVLAVFVVTLMVVGGAMAQGAGGAAGSGAGAGAASGSGSGGTGPTGTAGAGGGAVGTPGTPTTSGSDRSKAETPAGTPSGGAAASGSVSTPSASPATASADFSGRHTMEGEVVSVDQKKGHVTLKTAEGNMQLHFPPSALQQVKKGDRVSVELAMKPAGSASMKHDTKGAASPKTDDTKKTDDAKKKY